MKIEIDEAKLRFIATREKDQGRRQGQSQVLATVALLMGQAAANAVYEYGCAHGYESSSAAPAPHRRAQPGSKATASGPSRGPREEAPR